MPGGDGTGPLGTGPIGWGRGPCGRGLGFRRGFGRGFGRYFTRPVELTKEERIKILKAEKEDIEKALEELEKG
jgi:hypothetical protein